MRQLLGDHAAEATARARFAESTAEMREQIVHDLANWRIPKLPWGVDERPEPGASTVIVMNSPSLSSNVLQSSIGAPMP